MTISSNGDGSNTIPPLNFDLDFATPSDFAGYYRACGWQVVPAWAPGEREQWKSPRLQKWKYLQPALADDPTYLGWYGPSGDARDRLNMGLFTGPCSGNRFVVDLDVYKTPAARAWWEGILAVHNSGLDLETVEQVTGGGGIQKLFRAPPGYVVPTYKTATGVDVRGQGGFAMLPPSWHESGRHYAWAEGRAPWETEVSDAPQWLLDEIVKLGKEHGAKAPRAQGTAVTAPAANGGHLTAFGSYKDLREDLMFRQVWHAVLEWCRECPIRPPESEWPARAHNAYEVYERTVVVQDKTSTLSKREQLDIEGRGPGEWWVKWVAAMRKWGAEEFQSEADKPPPEQPEQPKASEPPPAGTPINTLPLVSAFPIDEAKLPVRDWVVPGLLLKRSLSVLVAPPGSGKSLLSLQLAIAIAVGLSWGGWTPRKPEKVLIINAEDDIDEMRRRLCAAARIMGIAQEQLIGRVFLVEAPESVVIAKYDNRTKSIIRTPLIEELVATFQQYGIGVAVADPFAETFEGDENSNSEVKWAGVLWREVARRTVTGLLLVHHTRKHASDQAGEADASRGGGALIGTARILVTLFGMTKDEAAAMNVAPEKRSDYVRFDDAKANYSKLEGARWLAKQTVTLANATAFLPGDEVGVLVPWSPPGALDGVSNETINQALDEIDRGLLGENGTPTGQRYTASVTTEHKSRWGGSVLVRVLGCSEMTAKMLIRTWLNREVLRVVDYADPVQRRSRKGLCAPHKNRPGAIEKFT